MFKAKFEYQLKSIGFVFSFSTVLILVLTNYCLILWSGMGQDAANLPSMVFTVIQSNEAPLNFIFRTLFPVVSILPGCFIYFYDKHNGPDIYLINRADRSIYYRDLLTVSFTVSFLALFIPLLISAGLSGLTFPTIGSNPFGYHHIFFDDLFRTKFALLFPRLFLSYPLIYCILNSFMIAALAGIFTVITVSISYWHWRYAVALLLPVFLFFYFSDVITRATASPISFNLLDLSSIQIRMGGEMPLLYPVIFLVISGLFVFFSYWLKVNSDVL